MTIARPTSCVNKSTHSSGRRRVVTPPRKSLTPHDRAAPSARTIDNSNECDCTARGPAIAKRQSVRDRHTDRAPSGGPLVDAALDEQRGELVLHRGAFGDLELETGRF